MVLFSLEKMSKSSTLLLLKIMPLEMSPKQKNIFPHYLALSTSTYRVARVAADGSSLQIGS